jgi:hypothetical protein
MNVNSAALKLFFLTTLTHRVYQSYSPFNKLIQNHDYDGIIFFAAARRVPDEVYIYKLSTGMIFVTIF